MMASSWELKMPQKSVNSVSWGIGQNPLYFLGAVGPVQIWKLLTGHSAGSEVFSWGASNTMLVLLLGHRSPGAA